TGRLDGAKPSIAPHSAAAISVTWGATQPLRPRMTIAAVTGTASATVIQSSPSMKLTRLTNQTPANRNNARPIQTEHAGTILKSAGADKTRTPTAIACKKSLGKTGIGLMSSTRPTAAMNSDEPNSATGIRRSAVLAEVMATPAAASVAARTPIPAPWGVGTRCDERAFGFASAYLSSKGESAWTVAADSNPARTAVRIAKSSSELIMLTDTMD